MWQGNTSLASSTIVSAPSSTSRGAVAGPRVDARVLRAHREHVAERHAEARREEHHRLVEELDGADEVVDVEEARGVHDVAR